MSAEATNDGCFLYTVGGGVVPSDATRLRVHPSVTAIPADAFRGCSNLRVVELPEGLLEIGANAFACCESLATINFPSTLRIISDGAFNRCGKLAEVTLPEGLQEIGESAFYCCATLEQINFPSTLTVVSAKAFYMCFKLAEVVLPEGLQEIGKFAFYHCKSLQKFIFPPSIKVIPNRVLQQCSNLIEVSLPDSVESMGEYAFDGCKLSCFRVPPLAGKTNCRKALGQRPSMFSLEVPESLEQLMLGDPLHTSSFPKCLRNVAIPPKCKGKEVFPVLLDDADLRSAFPTSINSSGIVQALECRFDGLPIHEKCYYQSYHLTEDVLADLERIIDPRARQTRSMQSKLNAIGKSRKSQDCLGMTPLHILACSTKHDLRLYQLLIENYPETLITKDKWAEIPLMYACWSRAPQEVLQLLIESHTTLFPDHVVDLISMLVKWANEDVKRPNDPSNRNRQVPFATFQCLLEFVTSSISERLESLDVKRWREKLEIGLKDDDSSDSSDSDTPGGVTFPRVKVSSSKLDLIDMAQRINMLHSRLVSYEQLKEATSLLELALWKAKMDEFMPNAASREGLESSQKKARVDVSIHRDQCRIGSGAEVVLPNVAPFLSEHLCFHNVPDVYEQDRKDDSSEDGFESEEEAVVFEEDLFDY